MTLPARINLKSFVTSFLERSGGLVEEVGYALVQAVLPEHLGLGDSLLLAFDYEVAQENPGAVFVAYGSRFLDNVARLAARYGRFTSEYHPGLTFKANRNYDREIAEGVEFLRCRAPRVVAQRPVLHAFFSFYFLAVFHTFERTEELVSVTVDGSTGLPAPDFERWWAGVVPVAEPEYDLAVEVLPLDQIYRTACAAAEETARERGAALQRQATGQLSRELGKVRAYYARTVQETEKKMEGCADPARSARLAKQLEAVRADWQRREKDCLERYAVSVELKPDHLVARYLPRLLLRAEAQSRDRVYNTTLIYNQLASRIETPVCPLCGKATTRLCPHPDGVLVCPGHG